MLLEEPIERFEEIYKIYEASFPAPERRTKEAQRRVTQNSRYRLRIKEESGEILAFLGYWELENCLFLEHLATTERCRGKGYGRELVLECVKDVQKPVFLEIEPVTEADPMTGRRADFYRRLDFHINHFPYEQQPLKEGDKAIPLWVMSLGREMTEEEFLPFKRQIYKNVYGAEL